MEIDVTIAAEMVSTIGEVAPWVDVPVLKEKVRKLALDRKLADMPETFAIQMSESLVGVVGNPPG